jgi:hypothetical protein
MSTQVQFRRGTTTDISTFIGADGEVVVDTTKKTCVVNDGVQPAGYPLLREDGSNSALNPGSTSSCALKFVNDANTGIISPGSDQIALVTGGASRLLIDSSGSVTVPGNLLVSGSLSGAFKFEDGSALNPAITFTNDPDTGIFRAGTNQLSVTTGGVQRFLIDGTGQLEAGSLGTASSPTWTFVADTNTGIYSPGADQVAISTNGTGKLFVDANGNVGILDSSPQRDAGTTSLSIGDGSKASSVDFYGTVNNYTIYNGGSGQFAVYDLTNATERITLTSTGRLGLGTSSPSAVFHISNLSGGTPAAFVENSASTGDALAGIRLLSHNGTSSTGQADIFATNNAWAYRNYGANALVLNAIGAGGAHLMASNASGIIKFSVGGDTTAQERMRLTSTGLGIGTTSPGNALHVVGSIQVGSTSDTIYSSNFGNYSSASDLSLISGSASLLFKTGAANDERARIDTSGRLLVGTSSALTNGDTFKSKLVVNGDTDGPGYPGRLTLNNSVATVLADYKLAEINFAGQAAGNPAASITCYAESDWNTAGDTTDNPGRLVFSTTADGASSPTERMRIVSTGRATFASDDPSVNFVFIDNNAGNTGSRVALQIYTGTFSSSDTTSLYCNFLRGDGTQRGQIRSNGATAVAYESASDYRLKENVVPLTNATARLQQLKPYRFNFIDDGPDRVVDGFFAHEVQEVIPEAAGGTKDAEDADGNPVYQGIDQSKLVPLLTAALQEAIAKIETLEAKVAALEGV